MKIRFVLLVILLLSSALCNTFSEDVIKVAILDFKGVNVEEYVPTAVVEILATSLIDSGAYEVIERAQLTKVLSEQNLQNSEEFDENIATDIGNLLGVEIVIIGSVTQLGSSITVNLRGIEVETGSARFAKKINATSLDELPTKIDQLVLLLTKDGDKEEVVVEEEKKEEREVKPKQTVQLSGINIGGIAMVATGSAVLIGGIAMLAVDLGVIGPNLDHIDANPADYTFKERTDAYNLNIGLLAGGIAASVVGLGMVAGGIPMILNKGKSGQLGLLLETGPVTTVGFSYKF